MKKNSNKSCAMHLSSILYSDSLALSRYWCEFIIAVHYLSGKQQCGENRIAITKWSALGVLQLPYIMFCLYNDHPK